MAVINTEKMEAKQISTEDKKNLLIAQELKIARLLAGNEKVSRDRALKSLKKWFQRRSANLAFTEEDFMRLWKGLFYSMWMSDKPLIQEECAENIAGLVHELPIEHALVLFKCGMVTLCNEWFGIDQFRLDKFLMFVRRLLRQALFVLKKDEFKKEKIQEFGQILSETVLDTQKKDILGLFMHVTEIFLEEVAKVSNGELKPHLVNEFLIPFIKTLVESDDSRRIKQIKKCIFTHLMFQSDVGLEYQDRYEAWKRQGFPGTIHDMKKIEVEEEKDCSDDEINKVGNGPLDPRAGRVDVEIPQIKFNAKLLADVLLKNKFTKNSTVPARREINIISQQLRKLAKGIYPLGVVDLRLPKQDFDDMNVRKAVNRLVKFDKKIMGNSQKRKKEEEEIAEPAKKKLKTKQKLATTIYEKKPKDNVEKLRKKPIQFQSEQVCRGEDIPETVLETKVSSNIKVKDLLMENGKMPEMLIDTHSGLWKVFDDAPECPDSHLERIPKQKKHPIKKTLKKTDGVLSNGIQKKKDLLKSKNAKKNELIIKQMKDMLKEKKESSNLGKQDIFPKNPWDEPLKEGEYEITIPSRSYLQKLQKISKKSTSNVQELLENSLHKKTACKLRKNGQCSTPEKTKKVKIDTSLNQSQEFDEYHYQMMTSPSIVYDANKKPGKPLLKVRGVTAMTPFYKKYKKQD